ncbi:uncharacterized protein LOC123316578 [Coccinella septempunctata]|uniref:uncharacterized protein LOC123316578 n=1 Tax=Coccinella septempunctata TaxID=41139 RepID=UPI001D07B769|nr:uncharacterized protein LOC123316578 [Coccinella septempunctata]
MKVNTVNIPDFAMNDNYWRQRKAKYERVHKFQQPEIVRSTKDVNTELSLRPNFDMPRPSERPGTEPYHKHFQVNRLHEKTNYYWNQTNGLQFSTKEFPEFKAPLEQSTKKHNVLKPSLVRSTSDLLKIEVPNKMETIQNQNKPREDSTSKKTNSDFLTNSKPYYSSNTLRTSKKVKWEDGYCASPSLEWYPTKTEYQNSYKDYVPSKTKPSYSYGNFLTYRDKEYKKYKYQDYDYSKYDYFSHNVPVTYSSSRKQRNSDYRDPFEYYTYEEYPKSSKYKNSDNWLYMEEDSRSYNPYHYEYDKRSPKKYTNSIQKSYRNSDTQYDLVERVHNKKLQVCQSDSSRISGRKVKLESKKVGDEKGGIRLTKSDEILNKREDACTQITENKHQSHQVLQADGNSETKQNDTQKLNDTTVISRLLVELTEKLKSSEHSLSSAKQKCILVEKGTQYVDCEMRKKPRTPKPPTSRRYQKSYDTKKHLKPRRSHLMILQHESTQYEEMKSCENLTSTTLNTEFEFERKFFMKDPNKENFCEIESTKKRKGLKSGICEERIYAKRFVKEIPPKMIKTDLPTVINSQGSVDSNKSDLKRIRHHRSYLNTKQCLPFLIDKSYKCVESPYEFTPRYAIEKIEKIENKKAKDKHHERKRSTSCEIEGEKSKLKHKDKCDKKTRRAVSMCSSKSDLSSPEDRYIEKYVVKLSNSKEELVLYDVKPKFCDYLSNKGVKHKIVQKLKSNMKV